MGLGSCRNKASTLSAQYRKDLQALHRALQPCSSLPLAIALALDLGNARFHGAEGLPSTCLLPAFC